MQTNNFRKFLMEDTPSNGAEMTWLQNKGEHMISAAALASSNKAGAPAIEHIRKHMEHANQVTFFFPLTHIVETWG